MLIDWFTVGAQVLNFLILVWLMKRFLYQPILRAIDAREERIAKELADAQARRIEAQKEHDEFCSRTKSSTGNAPNSSARPPTRRTPNGNGSWMKPGTPRMRKAQNAGKR